MTIQEILKWIAELFDESAESLSPETLREAVPAWDSLGVLTLMADLDEKFGIILTDSEMQSMTKVDDIIEVLRKNGKLSA